ncbi:MAG: MFS transporter [Bacteroidales bacterium]
MLYMPIIGLFYAENGLSVADLFILQAGYSVASGVFEIPSGYMADVWGRKKTLVLGSIMGAIGFSVYVVHPTFYYLLIAEIIMGIGQSFISGSDSAMLYDSLFHVNKEKKYLKLEGRITALGGFAETAAAVLGGTIAVMLSLHAVFVVQVIIAACAIPAALLLIEPPRVKLVQKRSLRAIFSISSYALFKHTQLSSAILLSSVIGTATLTMAWLIQAYVVEHAFSEKNVSVLWVALNLTVALVSLVAAYFMKKYGLHKLLLSIVLVVPFTYFIMGLSPVVVVIPLLFVFYFVRGYATPVLKDLIQVHCDSDIRATVLSVRGLIIRISFGIIAPLIGYFSRVFSLDTAILIIAGVFSLSIGAIYIQFVMQKKQNPF